MPVLLAAHKNKLIETSELVLSAIKENPNMTLDDLTGKLIQDLNIPNNIMQISLTRTCTNAYLSYLEQQNKISLSAVDGKTIATAVAQQEETSSMSLKV